MEAKEKALRLCQDIAMTTFGEDFNNGTTLPLAITKKIAVICVSLLLNEIDNVGGDRLTEDDDEMECSIMDRIEYYYEVKNHIQSL